MRIKVSIRNHRAEEREDEAKAEEAKIEEANAAKKPVEKVKKANDAAATGEPVVEVVK